jgi:hypothetical protein
MHVAEAGMTFVETVRRLRLSGSWRPPPLYRRQDLLVEGTAFVKRMALVFLAGLLVTGLARSDCRAAAPSEVASKKPEPSDPEKSFGIRILSLRPTAEGQMLDLRFRVVDPEKPRPSLTRARRLICWTPKQARR